jgi:hypothetical protein
MPTKAEQVIDLLNYVRKQKEDFYAGLPEAVRTADGTWEKWSPKDVVGHLTFWQNSTLNALKNLEQPPPEQPPFEERNRQNYLNYEKTPWAQVDADYARTFDEIVAHTGKYSDEELTEPNHFPRITNGTLQSTILGNAYSHAVTHLSELFDKYGASTSGKQLQEQSVEKLLAFDPSPRTKGVTYYNLACYYALEGNVGRAVDLLKEAFPLRPDLVEFSKEDSDFNKVRDLPEFQALYA